MKEYVILLHNENPTKTPKFTCSSCNGVCYYPQAHNARDERKNGVICDYKFCPNCGLPVLPKNEKETYFAELKKEFVRIDRVCKDVAGNCGDCSVRKECAKNTHDIAAYCEKYKINKMQMIKEMFKNEQN